MGFRYGRTYVLKFEDGDLDGLTVTVRPTTLDQLIEILDTPRPKTHSEATQRLTTMLRYFCAALDGWNLESRDGVPTPHDPASITAEHPRELIDAILAAWIHSMTAVPRPLEPPSTDGDTSLEASIPMEVSSPSP